MGQPKLKPQAELCRNPVQITPDLVGVLLAHHRERIEPCMAFEVRDLADEFSHRYGQHITETQVLKAIGTALGYLEE